MIDYTYDPLYRLTAADYASGAYYHYTYDANGNRLSEQSHLGSHSYTYDSANRLTNADGVDYTWDANGNLLYDGVNSYAYDSANRLTQLNSAGVVAAYAYNGLGDRLRETVNGVPVTFQMDLNQGLTQTLSDGATAYVYGAGRLAQINGGMEYFLGDALGSVRQLVDGAGALSLAQSFDPYGQTQSQAGDGASSYAFTGEYSANGLVYLRARHYAPSMGRFLTRDTWAGDANRPQSLNRWAYVEGNPVRFTDPSGKCIICIAILGYWSYSSYVNIIAPYLGLGPDLRGVMIAERYMDPSTDSIIVAASIAVQSQWYVPIWDSHYRPIFPTQSSGLGIAQVSDGQMLEYGLDDLNQDDPSVAIRAMNERIKRAQEVCIGCSATDLYIVAALAQNGPGLDAKLAMNYMNNNRIDWIRFITDNYRFPKPDPQLSFREMIMGDLQYDTQIMLRLFTNNILELQCRGWKLPEEEAIDWDYISALLSTSFYDLAP